MSGRSLTARERWTRIVEEQRSSGLTVGRFCELRGIAPSSFFPWRKRLRAATTAPAFVEAKVRGLSDGLGGSGSGSGGAGVTITAAGGRRIIVERGFDRQVLLEVIGVLESAARSSAGAGEMP